MNVPLWVEKLLRVAVFPCLAAMMVVQVMSFRALYGDGSVDLVSLLQAHGYSFWDKPRLIHHIIVQTPLALALKLGVHDMTALKYLFCAGLSVPPLLIWGAALWNLRDDMLYWPFAAVFAFAYFNTALFAPGEYNLCFAVAAYIFSRLVLPLPPARSARWSLMAAALILPFNYPSTLFHGPALLYGALTKPAAEWNGVSRAYRMVLMALFLLSAVSAGWEVAAPRDPANFASAASPVVFLYDWMIRYLFVCMLAMAGLAIARREYWRYGLGLVVVAAMPMIVFDQQRLYWFSHYAVRGCMAGALTICGIGLVLLRRHYLNTGHDAAETGQTRLFPTTGMIALPLLVMLCWLDMRQSLDFAAYLHDFANAVNGNIGLISYTRSLLPFNPSDQRFGQAWTYSSMSLVLRHDASKAIVLCPAAYKGYQPFDPTRNIPDLSRYYP